ncbi:Uncharacterised protein [uncultured archaeon]|nr:Uncharacterised protein [uncultured archaeon]
MDMLVEDGKAFQSKSIEGKDFSVLSEERIEILKILAKEPMYATQVAKLLKQEAQKIYYHFKILENAGLIKVQGYEEKQGGIAKKYVCDYSALTVKIGEKGVPFKANKHAEEKLFRAFNFTNFFDAKIIVGSPEPHGKYRAKASEFCVSELSAYIGANYSFDYPLYLLDVEATEKNKKENLILVGGPKVNSMVEEINDKLPIKFNENFDLYSKITGKVYNTNNGVIEVIENPFNKSKKIMLVAGNNQHGTRAAILAILKKTDKLCTEKNGMYARIIEGFDENNDGIIDSVEILE